MPDSLDDTVIEMAAPEVERSNIHRVALKMPPFWADKPELWFAQIESQFTLSGITQDATRYAYVVSHIETRHTKEIRDLITRPPAAHKYESVKRALIQRLSISQEQQIRQLLEHKEIRDRKPSQFLRHLQSLAKNAMPEELLRTLWMGRLPAQLQAILATRTADDLEKVAAQADRVFEITGRSGAVASIQPATATPSTIEQQIKEMAQQVASLNDRFSRSANKTRQRERSQNRHRQKQEDSNICYYHRRFKGKAKKCTSPCKFKKQEEEN
ncbi:uncharacterized protein LOC118646789 [Monomorium pharaonis]|uniref:uncharacterized protein LOC118646789 n=1 Tax=Monomorium pharaonis TaxID=307658 RepID=UPI0017476BDD|nr:uncharacterized protein LOC118646789 [Monomorium pharaonis]